MPPFSFASRLFIQISMKKAFNSGNIFVIATQYSATISQVVFEFYIIFVSSTVIAAPDESGVKSDKKHALWCEPTKYNIAILLVI